MELTSPGFPIDNEGRVKNLKSCEFNIEQRKNFTDQILRILRVIHGAIRQWESLLGF
jgi:hypothetical protein